MKKQNLRLLIIASAAAAALAGCSGYAVPGRGASFFVTSANPGQGGNLGGLAGADAQCEKLATAAGWGGKGWHAYLSTQATPGTPAVNARDRIGSGPWVNAKGTVIAHNLAELHGSNNLNQQTGLTETGEEVPTKSPGNQHDIMTGSQPDGTAVPPGRDASCSNWTSSGAGGAMVGHVNRGGTNPDPVANVSWNSSHLTPGCGMPDLARVGGAGLMYCFATR